MKSLKEIEMVIYETECKDCLVDGWYRSQPILTKDESGELIDNYFMYGQAFSLREISSPLILFGIYSDSKNVAYKKDLSRADVKEYPNEPIDVDTANSAYSKYEELYPMIRECAFTTCSDEQKKAVQDYMRNLELFSGPVLWRFYNELFPSFFEWARSI